MPAFRFSFASSLASSAWILFRFCSFEFELGNDQVAQSTVDEQRYFRSNGLAVVFTRFTWCAWITFGRTLQMEKQCIRRDFNYFSK